MRLSTAAFLMFCMISAAAWGQAGDAPQAASGVVPGSQVTGGDNVVKYAEFARPRRMIYYFQADPEEFNSFDRSVLYRSVLMAVGSANPNVVLLESPESEVPATQQGMEELARQIDADCWLRVSLTGGMANARIEVETFDILKQQRFGAQVIEPGYPLDYRTVSNGFWDSVTNTIRTDYGAVVDTLRVTVEGVPGTRVAGLGSKELVLGEGGALEITLPNPATYTIDAVAPGFYPVKRTFYLGYDALVEKLDQVRAARFGVDVDMNALQFPGARFWYFPVPATLYVRGGFTTYAIGMYFINSTPSILRGNPLTRLEAGAGWFFSPPGRNIRLYAGGDLGLRIAHGVGDFGIDPYAPVAADITAGIEYSPGVHLRFFAEYSPTVYYTPDSAQFRLVSFPGGEAVPGYLFFQGYSVDIRSFRVGIRYTW